VSELRTDPLLRAPVGVGKGGVELKSCPTCLRLYPDDGGFCPVDGVPLLPLAQVPVVANPEDARVGRVLCQRYQVRRVVADGGMGRVYEALDTQGDLRVAIKVLHPDVARDEVSVERFKREFDVSKLLPHAHIVEVRDFAETDDQSFALVMDFLDGEELRNVLKREKHLYPERLVRMLSQVALGLDEAHKKQLVHRDLKPDNLFLCGTHDGDLVKVLDFGSVKDKSSMAKKLTVVGTTIGSPFYMAPEQAQGLETLDARADVWGLAAIAYECITGSVPFKGSSGPAILLAILTKDPEPPTRSGAGSKVPIPPALDDIMEVALAKNPQIRTHSVGALADEIGRAYGLAGDHRQWAYTPQPELAAAIQRELPRLLVARPASDLGALADPFAMPPGGPNPMDRAFQQAARPAYSGDEVVMGVPRGTPKWLVPALIGALALVLALVGVVILLK
jgi:eukaryotic-like serine/threonine-protein kinase